MSADPFSVVSASSLRSVNSDPGSSSNGPANFARISRAAIWKSTSADGNRAPASVESTSDALVFSTRSSTVRPLPVNVNAPVSDPSNRSSSSHFDFERRREAARVQPCDVAARRVAELPIARFACRAACPARSARLRRSSRSSVPAAGPVAPLRLERIVAGGLRLELRHREPLGQPPHVEVAERPFEAIRQRPRRRRESERRARRRGRAVRGAAGIEAQNGLSRASVSSRGTSYTPCARTFAA